MESVRTPTIHPAGLVASHYTAAFGEAFGAIISLLFELVLMATTVIEIPRRLDGLAEQRCDLTQVWKRAVAPVSLAIIHIHTHAQKSTIAACRCAKYANHHAPCYAVRGALEM